MSQENVDFLAGLIAGAEALDKDAMLAALPELIEQACDPEIEWVEDPQRADGRVYRGHNSVYTFRAGKILRYQEFYDERQALEAAGVRE